MWLYSPYSHMTQLVAQVILRSVTLNASDVKPNHGDTGIFLPLFIGSNSVICSSSCTYSISD